MPLAGIFFVLSPGPTTQAWDHSGPSDINHQPRKHPTGQSGGGIFLNEVPTSQMTVIYIQLILNQSILGKIKESFCGPRRKGWGRKNK